VANAKKDQTRVLFITACAEFGERYSYHLMQVLLIFLLLQKFNFMQSQSVILMGTVISLIFMSAIAGGYIGDKLMGHYPAAYLGAWLMLIGNSLLTYAQNENNLLLGLTLIAISTGLIKANIASFIGHFYDQTHLSSGYRDFGFNLFYAGIGLGSLLGLCVASFLKDHYGFIVAFYSNICISGGMIVALSIGWYTFKPYLGFKPYRAQDPIKITLTLLVYIALVFIVLKKPLLANILTTATFLAAIIALIYSAQGKYWQNLYIALIFFLLSILYWTIYFQNYISILLFIDHAVSHEYLGLKINDSQFLSVIALSVIIFAPLLGKIWFYFSKTAKAIADIDKFNIGFISITSMFLLFYLGIYLSPAADKISASWFIFGFIILGASELCLATIGMALMTKIAPQGFVALYMGIWFMTIGFGGKLAGLIAAHITITPDIQNTKTVMQHGLTLCIAIGLIGILLCLCLRHRLIQKMKDNSQGP
jgi:POT family proton-dependent oligopeptide transporter